MKKKRLVLTALLALAYIVPSAAQYNYTSVDIDGSTNFTANNNTIVRKWNSQYAVCLSGNRLGIFDYSAFLGAPGSTTPTFPAKYMDIPSTVTVSDIQILGDSLYFCGRYSSSSQSNAVIGIIPLDINPLSATVIDYKHISHLHSISKMVVRRMSQYSARVVAIGKTSQSSYNNNCIVSVNNILLANCSYSTLPLASNDYADDITLLNNTTICISGRTATGQSDDIWRRKCSINSVLSSASTIYTKYTYSTGTIDLNSKLTATAVDASTIALTYVGEDANGLSFARVRVFTISNMENSDSFEFSIYEKNAPLPVTIQHHLTNNLFILQNYTNHQTGLPCTDLYAVAINNPSSTVPVAKTTFLNRTYSSISEISYLTKTTLPLSTVMLFSGEKWYLHNSFTVPFGYIPSYCHNGGTGLSAQPINNLTKQSQTTTGTPYSYTAQNHVGIISRYSATTTTDCIAY